MRKMMWFGNAEKMTWVPCPAIEMVAANTHWVARSDYLSGGIGLRRSATGAMEYDMNWNLMPESDIDRIAAFVEGAHGDGPFYFVDPQAMKTNVFPTAWAQPRVALKDGTPLLFDTKPTKVATSPFDTFIRDYPSYGAQYIVTEDSHPTELVIPMPPDHTFLVLCGQDFTADARMSASQDGGAWTPLSVNQFLSGSNGSMIRFRLEGTGYARVYFMWGQMVPTSQAANYWTSPFTFFSGKGNSGVEFESFERHVYSSALDLVGASAHLVEVAQWR